MLTKDFTLDLTLNDVIEESLDIIQVAADGDTLGGRTLTRARKSLNLMIKTWEAQGIHLWTYKEGTLFLVKDQPEYDFSTARLANSPIRTTTTAAEDGSSGTTVIACTSVTGMSVGMNFGVLKDDNTIFWSTIASISSLNVTINDGIDGTAASGKTVWAYNGGNPVVVTSSGDDTGVTFVVNGTDIDGETVTEALVGANAGASTTSQKYLTITQIRTVGNAGTVEVGISSDTDGISVSANPADSADLSIDGAFASAGVATLPGGSGFVPVSRILNVRREETSNYEIPIIFDSRVDYFDLPNKEQSGTPIQAYYSRQEPFGTMSLWNAPISEAPVINFTYERKLQVVKADGDFLDFPDYWFEALAFNLAKRLMIKFGGVSPQTKIDIKEMALETLDTSLGFDNAVYSLVMDMEQYG